MADKKISQLSAATTPVAGTEVLPIVQSGSTVKVSIDNLTTGKNVPASSFNKVAITAPATSATLTIADGKTLRADNTLTFAGTDSTTMTFPSTSASIARTDAAQSFSGTQTFSSAMVVAAGTVSAPSVAPTGDSNTGIYFPAADSVGIATGGSDAVLISSLQNVGIGATPATFFSGHSNLQVGAQAVLGANKALATSGQTYLSHNLYFDAAGNWAVFNTTGANEGAAYQMVDGAHLWKRSDATTGTPVVVESARINNLGYFKAADNGTYNNVGTDAYHEFDQSADNWGLLVKTTNASQTATSLEVRASRDTTNGTFNAIRYFNVGAGAAKFIVADSGNVTNTNGTYGTISDAKMKTDIVDAGSQWDDVKAIRFRKFKMKSDSSGITQLGVVAQELEQTSPGLVEEHRDTDADGNDLGTTTKSVKTSVLLMKAAKALQEAMDRIEKLESKVAALESK